MNFMEKPAFSRHIFWETDYELINWEEKYRYVIEKVVMYGNMKDWRMLQTYYGMEKIKESVLNARVLEPKTLNFMSQIFNIPISDFRCYIYKQSNPTHWEY